MRTVAFFLGCLLGGAIAFVLFIRWANKNLKLWW